MAFCVATVVATAAAVFAGAAAASSGEGAAIHVPSAQEGSAASPARPDNEFSLRHIPEALPLSVAKVAEDSGSGWYQDQELETQQDLSTTRAVLYSLLLPGLGDWYAGQRDRAKVFFIVDAALWTTFAVFRIQGHQHEDGYQEYARTFAGVARTDHSDDFYSTIGQFDSSDDYEAEFKKESRLDLWPDVGSEALERYYFENRLADFEEWEWRSFDDRVDYRELRSSSKLAYRRSSYLLAAAALNRVIASVFAYHAVKASRDEAGDTPGSEQQRGGYHLDISGPTIDPGGGFAAAVSLTRSF